MALTEQHWPNDAGRDKVLARAWPNGVPTDETAYLRSLTDKRQIIVMARLEAMLAIENNPDNLVAAAQLAGVGRTAFFSLRRAWKANRSLRVLAPYEPRERTATRFVEPGKRDGSKSRRQVAERTAAVDAIRADPSAGNDQIAALVAERTASTLDRRTLTSLVRQERRLLHFSPHLLLGVYGRSLVGDVSAIDLSLSDEGQERTAVASFIIERATGLVLGYSVGIGEDGVRLQRQAAQRAVAFLARERADVVSDVPVTMRLVVGPGSDDDIAELAASATSVLGETAVVSTGRLRFGRRAASLIGRAGRIALRPMATMPAEGEMQRRAARPSMTTAEADALLGVELERHNRSALDALRMVGLASAGEARGAMARLITDVFKLAVP
ncbi:MAG: hypothetical protein K2Y20_13075 [Sphingomonas sp.]|nr:hypothetical protein [Sphingomonas sp.]